jgi:hypothetical protein
MVTKQKISKGRSRKMRVTFAMPPINGGEDGQGRHSMVLYVLSQPIKQCLQASALSRPRSRVQILSGPPSVTFEQHAPWNMFQGACCLNDLS